MLSLDIFVTVKPNEVMPPAPPAPWAGEALGELQLQMKRFYYRKAVVRKFQPGDKVMVYFPSLIHHSLLNMFSGQYLVKVRLSD